MLANQIKETVSAAPLLGDILLGGKFSNKYIAFSQKFEDGDPVYYKAEDGDDSELGIGIYNSTADSITRTTPLETTDSGVYDDTSPAVISLTSATIVHVVGLAQTQNGKARVIESTDKYFTADNIIYLGDLGKGGGAFTAAAGRITARYYYFAHRTLITTLGAEVRTASASGNFDISIYGLKPGSINGGDLLSSTGNLATDATGVISATLGTPLNLAAGWYLCLVKVDNTTAEFAGARPASSRFILMPKGGESTGRGAHMANYWNTTYTDAFLSTIDGYGAPAGSTPWETPEAIMS